ncbi:MAG TPA: N-acetyl-gamma-glutamyl-phosphate reductase [Terriglobales bacterium]|nr:N-acetyl-gamma-glutamyl-phosphate reductase [Terriglobales bacterium]
MQAKVQTAVLGASGYAGMELARLLTRHPRTGTPLLLRRESDSANGAGTPPLSGNGHGPCLQPFSWATLEKSRTNVLFLATPHEVSRELAPEAVERGIRVIDLSGAWRLKREQHRAVYGFRDPDPHKAASFTDQAVYGLPELNRERIAGAQVVANPGCYATSVILALAPLLRAGLVDRERGIISDSKSGVSGAGKEPSARTHFVSVADNLSAYAVFGHRHVGEILEQLQLESQEFTFTPHLLPIPRGILSTIYVRLRQPASAGQVESCFRQCYGGRPWVRVFAPPELPQIQFSLHSNYCDIGFCLADDGQRLVLISCVDNLLKGAAGQAVQNMNLMYGWDEKEGLN